MPVHMFGQCADMTEINKIAHRYNLFVVEDACQSVGSSWNSNRAGSMGTTGCFSFFPSKNLGAFGDGGAVTTNDEDLYQRLLRIRNHGQGNNKTYVYDAIGGNFRLDTIQAAVLNIKLKYLENWSEMRNRNADLYNTSLTMIEGIEIPYCHPMSSHVYNQYVIKSKHRDDLREKLSSRDIGSAIYYPSPLHLQSSMSGLGYKEGDFPVAEEMCKSVLALPIYPELSEEEITCVISCLGSK
jgi:dTDP-4-amino-4,6-dideoxygalactose transaminase